MRGTEMTADCTLGTMEAKGEWGSLSKSLDKTPTWHFLSRRKIFPTLR